MTPRQRTRLVIGALLTLWVATACGAGAFTTRPETESDEPEQTEYRSDAATTSPVVRQATLPAGRIDVPARWTEGDLAFQAADFVTAQESFGLVYVADPMYRSGQVRAALLETCRAVGNDCLLVLGRLDFLRIEYSNQFGPRSSWVAQQNQDYDAILSCWDQALAGNLDVAHYAGHGVTGAPLPAFSQSAQNCVARVESLRVEHAQEAAQQQALDTWRDVYPDYETAWQRLEWAIDAADWDAIVDAYPGYKVAEEPVADILDQHLLNGDSGYTDQLENASAWLETARTWEAEFATDYETMRDAIRTLDDNDAYNDAIIEYEALFARLRPIQDEMATLELARDATTGNERRSVERRIEAKEVEAREIRRDLRRMMAGINNMREEVGLPSRETPYGLE